MVYKSLTDLTFISIAFNNENELIETVNSYKDCMDKGASCIIVNGGYKFRKNNFSENTLLIEEPDKGIFDALNKGIDHVKTKYFVLIHSGDLFSGELNYLEKLILKFDSEQCDLMLGSQVIPLGAFYRKHSSTLWSPYFLLFGAQPPHMPTIYRTEFARKFKYDVSNKVIADFFYFRDIFKSKPIWCKYKKTLVTMAPGGNTTSGLSSFILVSKEFIKNYGFIRGWFIALARIPFKIIQMF